MDIIIYQGKKNYYLNKVVKYNYLKEEKILYVIFKEVSVKIEGVDRIEEVR